MIVNACKAINKAWNILRSIDSAADLKKHKLTLADYTAAKDLFKNLTTPGASTTTYYSSVAAFYEKCDFLVVPENGYYIIFTEAE